MKLTKQTQDKITKYFTEVNSVYTKSLFEKCNHDLHVKQTKDNLCLFLSFGKWSGGAKGSYVMEVDLIKYSGDAESKQALEYWGQCEQIRLRCIRIDFFEKLGEVFILIDNKIKDL